LPYFTPRDICDIIFCMYRKITDWFAPKAHVGRIHLDYAATTPVHPEVLSAMQPYWNEVWANPSALYREGVAARKVIESARTELARTLKIKPQDVTFTSGGTEANNLALIGLVRALHGNGRAYADMEIVSTRIEHPSITETLAYLEELGVGVRYAALDEDGRIDIQALQGALTLKTVLVTCAYVNSEIGVVQDLKKITRVVRAWNEAQGVHVYVHTDASQAPLWLSCALDMLGVDLMTLDAGKCYGPKGVGILAHRHWVPMRGVTFGGAQENALRAGTENTPLIVGCVRAIVRAQEGYIARSEAIASLRDRFFEMLLERIPGVVINGSREHRVANNVHISIPGVDTEYGVIWLDARGIAASTKSACGVGKGNGSQVVRELTHDEARALSTLRFTLGEETRADDVARATEILESFCARMRNAA
jgi:cysteine desulfurase